MVSRLRAWPRSLTVVVNRLGIRRHPPFFPHSMRPLGRFVTANAVTKRRRIGRQTNFILTEAFEFLAAGSRYRFC